MEAAIRPLKEQVAALPETADAHKTAVNGLKQTQQELSRQHQVLKELEKQLAKIDQREQTIKSLGVEIGTLKERVDNGKDKVGGQKTLITEAEKAKKIVAENTAGKQSYEQAEKCLVGFRGQEKLQRQLEKEAADLEKQVGASGECSLLKCGLSSRRAKSC